MAEFQEVAKAYVRMCESYSTCEGCPIQVVGNDLDTCRCVVLKWPSKYESKIMAWAAAHPEPVYPTWREWLIKKGLIDFKPDFRSMTLLANSVIECLNEKASEPIPADIAKSLGLEPKEG